MYIEKEYLEKAIESGDFQEIKVQLTTFIMEHQKNIEAIKDAISNVESKLNDSIFEEHDNKVIEENSKYFDKAPIEVFSDTLRKNFSKERFDKLITKLEEIEKNVEHKEKKHLPQSLKVAAIIVMIVLLMTVGIMLFIKK